MDANKKYLFIGAKDPDETLDYQWDWAQWLGSDTIATSTFIVSPSGLTVDAATNGDRVTTVWLTDGVAGTVYEITNRIVTLGGRTADRTAQIVCQSR